MSIVFDILKQNFPYQPKLDVNTFYKKPPYSDNKYRRSKVLILLCIMSNYDKFRLLNKDEQNDIVVKIETSCYNNAIKKTIKNNVLCSWSNRHFVLQYKSILYERIYALDYRHNKILIEKIVSKKIKPESIGFMTTEELNQNDNELLKICKERRDIKLIKKTSTMYTCPNCHRNECEIEYVQLRALDESKDTSILCTFCQYHWINRN